MTAFFFGSYEPSLLAPHALSAEEQPFEDSDGSQRSRSFSCVVRAVEQQGEVLAPYYREVHLLHLPFHLSDLRVFRALFWVQVAFAQVVFVRAAFLFLWVASLLHEEQDEAVVWVVAADVQESLPHRILQHPLIPFRLREQQVFSVQRERDVQRVQTFQQALAVRLVLGAGVLFLQA